MVNNEKTILGTIQDLRAHVQAAVEALVELDKIPNMSVEDVQAVVNKTHQLLSMELPSYSTTEQEKIEDVVTTINVLRSVEGAVNDLKTIPTDEEIAPIAGAVGEILALDVKQGDYLTSAEQTKVNNVIGTVNVLRAVKEAVDDLETIPTDEEIEPIAKSVEEILALNVADYLTAAEQTKVNNVVGTVNVLRSVREAVNALETMPTDTEIEPIAKSVEEILALDVSEGDYLTAAEQTKVNNVVGTVNVLRDVRDAVNALETMPTDAEIEPIAKNVEEILALNVKQGDYLTAAEQTKVNNVVGTVNVLRDVRDAVNALGNMPTDSEIGPIAKNVENILSLDVSDYLTSTQQTKVNNVVGTINVLRSVREAVNALETMPTDTEIAPIAGKVDEILALDISDYLTSTQQTKVNNVVGTINVLRAVEEAVNALGSLPTDSEIEPIAGKVDEILSLDVSDYLTTEEQAKINNVVDTVNVLRDVKDAVNDLGNMPTDAEIGPIAKNVEEILSLDVKQGDYLTGEEQAKINGVIGTVNVLRSVRDAVNELGSLPTDSEIGPIAENVEKILALSVNEEDYLTAVEQTKVNNVVGTVNVLRSVRDAVNELGSLPTDSEIGPIAENVEKILALNVSEEDYLTGAQQAKINSVVGTVNVLRAVKDAVNELGSLPTDSEIGPIAENVEKILALNVDETDYLTTTEQTKIINVVNTVDVLRKVRQSVESLTTIPTDDEIAPTAEAVGEILSLDVDSYLTSNDRNTIFNIVETIQVLDSVKEDVLAVTIPNASSFESLYSTVQTIMSLNIPAYLEWRDQSTIFNAVRTINVLNNVESNVLTLTKIPSDLTILQASHALLELNIPEDGHLTADKTEPIEKSAETVGVMNSVESSVLSVSTIPSDLGVLEKSHELLGLNIPEDGHLTFAEHESAITKSAETVGVMNSVESSVLSVSTIPTDLGVLETSHNLLGLNIPENRHLVFNDEAAITKAAETVGVMSSVQSSVLSVSEIPTDLGVLETSHNLLGLNIPEDGHLVFNDEAAITKSAETVGVMNSVESSVLSVSEIPTDLSLLETSHNLLGLNIPENRHLTSSDELPITKAVETVNVLNNVEYSLSNLSIPSNISTLDASAQELLQLQLNVLSPEQQTDLNQRISTVQYLSSTSIPDYSDRADEINTAKANVNFIVGLSDLPTQEELNEADKKVKQLGALLPSWQQMNDTIKRLVERVEALEGHEHSSAPTTFEALSASVEDANPKKITVALPEGIYTGGDLQASYFQVSVNGESSITASEAILFSSTLEIIITFDSFVPRYGPTSEVLLTFTGTLANENGDKLSMTSFSVTNNVMKGLQLVSSKTYQTDDMNIELVVNASGNTVTFTDYNESTGGIVYQYNSSGGFYYEDSGYTNCIHFTSQSDTTFTGTRNGQSFSVTEYSIPSGPTTFEASSASVENANPKKITVTLPDGIYTGDLQASYFQVSVNGTNPILASEATLLSNTMEITF